MVKSSDAHKRAAVNFNRRQDNIMIRPSKAEGAIIRAAAADAGLSVQQYILQALRVARGLAPDCDGVQASSAGADDASGAADDSGRG